MTSPQPGAAPAAPSADIDGDVEYAAGGHAGGADRGGTGRIAWREDAAVLGDDVLVEPGPLGPAAVIDDDRAVADAAAGIEIAAVVDQQAAGDDQVLAAEVDLGDRPGGVGADERPAAAVEEQVGRADVGQQGGRGLRAGQRLSTP